MGGEGSLVPRTAEDIIMTQGGLTQLLPLTIIGIVIEGKQGTRE